MASVMKSFHSNAKGYEKESSTYSTPTISTSRSRVQLNLYTHKKSKECYDPTLPYDFVNIDETEDPNSFINYLDQSNENTKIQESKKSLITILGSKQGDWVLDLGCGVGHDSLRLGKIVGKLGKVIGVDASRLLLKEAKKRACDSRLNMHFLLGDAHQLEFHNNTFDGCWVVGLFMHLENPQKALSEIFRVLKPGARLVVLESDWETLVLTTGNTRRTSILSRLIKNNIRNPGIGHVLPLLFKKIGFKEVRVGAGTFMVSNFALANIAWRIHPALNRAVKASLISLSDAEALKIQLEQDSEDGNIFGAATGFCIAGKKL